MQLFGGIRDDLKATEWGKETMVFADARNLGLFIKGELRRRRGITKFKETGGTAIGFVETQCGDKTAVFFTSAGAIVTETL